MSLIRKKFILKKKIINDKKKLLKINNITFYKIYNLNVKYMDDNKLNEILNFLYNETGDIKKFENYKLLDFLIKYYYNTKFKIQILEIINNINENNNNLFFADFLFGNNNFVNDILNFEENNDLLNIHKIHCYFNLYNYKYSKVYKENENNNKITNFWLNIKKWNDNIFIFFFFIIQNLLCFNLQQNNDNLIFRYFIENYYYIFENYKLDSLNIIFLIINKYDSKTEIEYTFSTINSKNIFWNELDNNFQENLINNYEIIFISMKIVNFYLKNKLFFNNLNYINIIKNYLENIDFIEKLDNEKEKNFINEFLEIIYINLKLNPKRFNYNLLFNLLNSNYIKLNNYEEIKPVIWNLLKIINLFIKNNYKEFNNYFINYFHLIFKNFDYIVIITELNQLKYKIILALVKGLIYLIKYDEKLFKELILENENKIENLMSIGFLNKNNKYIPKIEISMKILNNFINKI